MRRPGIRMTIRPGWLMFVLIATLVVTDLPAQGTPQKATRQTALISYSSGNYEQAYREFRVLMQNYTKDPLYKYYSGVCLVRLNSDPETAAGYLQEAVSGSLEIRPVPDDAWFYLGRAQQMSGRFNEAIISFDEFVAKAGKKDARGYNVSQFIHECREGQGKLANQGTLHADILKNEEPVVIPASRQPEKVEDRTAGNKTSVQREKLPDEYDKILSDGMNYQMKADSLNTLSTGYKKTVNRLPEEQQQAYRKMITATDSLAVEYQKQADQKLGADTNMMNVNQDVATAVKESAQTAKPVQGQTKLPVNDVVNSKAKVAGEQRTVEPEAAFSHFDILTNPAAINSQKIEIDPVLPSGLIYRIQMGVFSKPVAPSFFKGITPVTGFRVTSSGMIRFFAGMFRRMDDANKALLRIKQLGFKDSFLVAISNGAPVSIERASLLEKEWGQKPLYEKAVTELKNPSEETGPPTLSYRVEIARSEKPREEEVVESYRKMSGSRGFEILTLEDGTNVYLIGKFITFESASDYAGLLIRNGYRDSKVVAYLGNREIPVETAKQLFEKIE